MGVREETIEKDEVNGARFSRVGVACQRVGLVVRETDSRAASPAPFLKFLGR